MFRIVVLSMWALAAVSLIVPASTLPIQSSNSPDSGMVMFIFKDDRLEDDEFNGESYPLLSTPPFKETPEEEPLPTVPSGKVSKWGLAIFVICAGACGGYLAYLGWIFFCNYYRTYGYMTIWNTPHGEVPNIP